MADGLRSLGCRVYPTAANFILVRIGEKEDVERLKAALWEHLIQVRDCASFGLEGFIRLGARSEADIRELIGVIAAFKAAAKKDIR
jgi:histidinol-phosphate/aromatic aminotransferase/cobyric acid decarboxylase-like protein